MKQSQLGKRHLMVFVGFLINALLGVLRQGMSVAIVSMVNHTESLKSSAESLTADKNWENSTYLQLPGDFDWSPQMQGVIFSASFSGYVITNLLAGRMAEVYGVKITITLGGILAGVSTLLSPAAAWWNVYAFIAAQFARGLGQGFTLAPLFVLGTNWMPRKERGMMNTLMLSGLSLGCLVSALLVGKVCDTPGLEWPASFYITGGLDVVIVLMFAFLFYEKPQMHPHISNEELKYIMDGQESDTAKESPPVPWKRMLTSVPMYALLIGLFGNFWGFTYIMSVHATFLGVVIQYSMTMVGILSSLPYLAMFIACIISSFFSIYLTSGNLLSTNIVRKGCSAICGLGFTLSFLGLIFFGHDKIFNIVAVVVAEFSLGVGMSGTTVVAGDMSPVFAGTIWSVTSTFACLAACFMPVIGGIITQHESFEEWEKVFYMNIGVLMLSTIVFLIFGSAEIQPWNSADIDEEKNAKNTENQYCSTTCILETDTSNHI